MAVGFSSARLASSSPPAATGAATFVGLLRLTTDTNNYATLIAWEAGSGGNRVLETDADGTTLTVFDSVLGDMFSSRPALTVGVDYAIALRYDASRNGTLSIKPLGPGTPTHYSSNNPATSFAATQLSFGGSAAYGEFLAGNLAAWRVYSARLSDGEVEAEMDSLTPVRTSDLHADYRFVDQAGRLTDSSGNARNLTSAAGSTSTQTNPTIAPSGVTGTFAATGEAGTLAASGVAGANEFAATGELGTLAASGSPVIVGAFAATGQDGTLAATQVTRVNAIRFDKQYASGLEVQQAPNPDLNTFRCWVRVRELSPALQMCPMSIENPAADQGAGNHIVQMFETRYGTDAPDTFEIHSDDYPGSGLGGFLFTDVIGAGVWVYLCQTNNFAAGRTTLYWRREDDAELSSDSSGNHHPSMPTISRLLIGTMDCSDQNEAFDGDIAGPTTFNREMTEEEVLADSQRLWPVDRADLHQLYPLQSLDAKLVDESGNGFNLSEIGAGTWTLVTDGPAIPLGYEPPAPITGAFAATGVAGTLAASGTPVVSGTVASTGASGSLSSTGTPVVTGTFSATGQAGYMATNPYASPYEATDVLRRLGLTRLLLFRRRITDAQVRDLATGGTPQERFYRDRLQEALKLQDRLRPTAPPLFPDLREDE